METVNTCTITFKENFKGLDLTVSFNDNTLTSISIFDYTSNLGTIVEGQAKVVLIDLFKETEQFKSMENKVNNFHNFCKNVIL